MNFTSDKFCLTNVTYITLPKLPWDHKFYLPPLYKWKRKKFFIVAGCVNTGCVYLGYMHMVCSFVFPGFVESYAIAPPLNIHNSKCEIAADYTKKKNVMRLHLTDGAEYLFETSNHAEMVQWCEKVNNQSGTLNCSYHGDRWLWSMNSIYMQLFPWKV